MTATLYVALGGAIGSIGRFWLGLAMAGLSKNLPVGTIVINIIGSFIIAFFGALSIVGAKFPMSENLRLFVLVGLCGGFTTFSSFSLQSIELLREGAFIRGILNIFLSVVLCLCATTIGFYCAQKINKNPSKLVQEQTEKNKNQ
ncbi:fluoride efflux transporter CrcB [Bartonella tamiae]|uniref:Fluoride-specific ion channel FluC n=1 Tax=Bartonella tamiae Th239 TaxID=1094558 RepID=J0QTX7_9HYPH|nr:fluoride efflux transporter CrcB [Bartonella tamiae]EJF89361.1 crcB protein [Bartonella tamiae Th239]EJF92774.1 crcB protein [Bartonella tamiae Th307]